MTPDDLVAPAHSEAIARFIVGSWHIQNSDRGEWLDGPGAKLLIGGGYTFHPNHAVDLHHIYRDNARSDIEVRRHGAWSMIRPTRLFLTFPDGYQELFACRADRALERLLAFGRIWERELIMRRS